MLDPEVTRRILIAIQSLQIPIIVILVIFGSAVYNKLNLRPFKFLYLAFLVDCIYIIFKLGLSITWGHKPEFIVIFINAVIHFFAMHISVFEFEKVLKNGVDILLNLLTSYLLIFSIKEEKIIKKDYLNIDNRYHIAGFIAIYGFVVMSYFYGVEQWADIFLMLVNMVAIGIFYHYTNVLDDIKFHFSFFWGLILYFIIQVLTLVPQAILESPRVEILGYILGATAKSLIAFGLIEIFIRMAKESVQNKLVADRLNEILGRTFHEIMPQVVEISNISKLLNKNSEERDLEIAVNKKAAREISRMVNVVSRLSTIISASHKTYISDVNFLKIESQLFGLDIPLGEADEINNINVLIEIAIMNFKSRQGREGLDHFDQRIVFHVEYGANCNVFCNAVELVQVFQNLFKNTFEAIGENGGRIFIKTKNIETLVPGINNELLLERFIQVEIEDNGPGIPLELQLDIFNIGFSTKAHEGKGRGYGLNIVKTYVEKNKGTYKLESPIEKPYLPMKVIPSGTKFVFTFPKVKITLN